MNEIKTANIKNLRDTAQMLHEFEENYIRKMFVSADSMWDKYKGNFPTEELKLRYEDIRQKSLFLKEFFEAVKLSLNYTAITAENTNKLLKGLEDMRIMQDGKVRDRLFKEQSEFLSSMFEQFEKINASYLAE
jgi:hypothetical protein